MIEIKSFNKQNLKDLRKELNVVLDTFSKKHNLNASIGNITFQVNECRTKLTIQTKSKTEPKQIIRVVGTNDSIKIGDVFQEKRTSYTVTKIDNKGLFQYSVVTQNGKRYKIKGSHLLSMTKLSNGKSNPSEPKGNDKMKAILNGGI